MARTKSPKSVGKKGKAAPATARRQRATGDALRAVEPAGGRPRKRAATDPRRNARPEIIGRWVPRPVPTGEEPLEETLGAACLEAIRQRADGKAIEAAWRTQDARAAAARERAYRTWEERNPDVAAFYAERWSTVPKVRGGGTTELADTLRQDLALPDDVEAIDIWAFLDAIVEIGTVAWEATIGTGEGALFNFEHAAAREVVQIGRKLRDGRDQAALMVRRQRLLGELTNIFQATSAAWGTIGSRDPDDPDDDSKIRLTSSQRALEAAQVAELRAFFLQHGFSYPPKDAYLSGKAIRDCGGPTRAAAETLEKLGLGGDSTLTKEHTRLSPMFEYRAELQPFRLPLQPEVERATTFARFMHALHRVASAGPPKFHFSDSDSPAERQARVSDELRLSLGWAYSKADLAAPAATEEVGPDE